MAREVAVHTAEEHLKDLRIDLPKTSLGQKNIKSRVSKGVDKKNMAGGGRFEVWEANTTCHNDVAVGYSKGIKSVGTKLAQRMTVENRNSMTCGVGDSEDEIIFNYMEKDAVVKATMDEMNEDTEDEEEEVIDENGIEQGPERGANVTTSGAAELRKKILWKKLIGGQRPNSILPECCNCEEVLEGKVYMCQVGHKFCKTCLRKKKVESVDLTLICLAHCGMDIIGRDRGMEAYLQKLMHRSG